MDKYLNVKQAAKYCGYSHIYFARIMDDYQIPRYGPKRNRLKQSDLDEWMSNPQVFAVVDDKEGRTTFRRVS